MTIKRKLVLLLLIPLVSIVVLGGQGFLESTHVASSMAELEELSSLAVKISAAVHETQKERGATGGFLGSKGEKFKEALPKQRATADVPIAELRAFLAEFDADHFGQEFSGKLNAAVAELDRLPDIRDRVSALSIPGKEALGYYTNMHARFLDAISVMTKQSNDAHLTVTINAYVNYLKGKERAGIERAVMTNTFAKGSFAPGVFQRFVSLMTEQNVYMSEFALGASEAANAFYQKTIQQPPFAEVQKYRDSAIASVGAGEPLSVDAAVWFKTITAKINHLKEAENFLSDELNQQAAQVRAAASTHRMVFGSLVLAIVAVTAGIGIWTVRSIGAGLLGLVGRVKDIAEGEGDLTKRVDLATHDELGELAGWFNKFLQIVHDLMASVAGVSNDVASAATQIAASSEQIAAGMAEQSSQVMHVSAAVEQMSSSVQEVARKSVDAAGDAGNAGEVATTGGEVVEQTIRGMAAIKEAVAQGAQSVKSLGKRGEEIGKIIEVINDIADQTNLLALNAAIEAARAGEHGRGFAVVADEVRKLADRTTKATDEIADSITAIQKDTTSAVDRMALGTEQVNSGAETAKQAGQSLQEIVSKAQQVASVVQSIAAAAEQQGQASEQVSRNVDAIRTVTTQTAEGTSQMASASSELSLKAEQLRTLVGKFKFDESAQS